MGIGISDILGGSLFDSVGKIISQFHMSPEDKAKVQAELEAQKAAIQTAENDYNAKLNDIAGQNIRAEEQSGDKYTVRARPSVIWVGLAVIVWNYCLMNFLTRWGFTVMNLPDAFWWTFSTVTTGYVFNRTAEKIMQMPGDSSIKLPFGVQLGQKSPPQ